MSLSLMMSSGAQGQGAQDPRNEAYSQYAALTAGRSATQKLGSGRHHHPLITAIGTSRATRLAIPAPCTTSTTRSTSL